MTVPDGSADRVRLRPHWGQSAPNALLVLCYGSALDHMRSHGLPGQWFPQFMAALLIVVTVADLVLTRVRTGVLLTPEGATVTRWRRRVVPWDRVTSLVEPSPGTRSNRRMGLGLVDGSVLRLPAPADGGFFTDPAFARRAAAVREFYHRYGPAPTGRPTVVVPAAEGLVVRVPLVRLLWPAGVAPLAVLVLCLARGHHGLGTVFVTVVVTAVTSGPASWFNGMLVTTGGLRFHRRLRRRDVLWTSVRSVTAEDAGPGRRLVLTLVDGTRLPLPAPRTGRLLKDPKYDERAAAVLRWWAACGGPRP